MANKEKLASKYNALEVEKGRYHWWKSEGLLQTNENSKKPRFTIVLPPPNVTGKLHLGHAWDNSLADAIIRFKKLTNHETLFIPGMDHAGIATQTKLEKILKQQTGKSRWDFGRTAFVNFIWEWKKEYGNLIRKQWAQLGLALDYNFEKFTLDPDVNQLVNQIFVDFYNKGLIYKGKRIVNWDPIQKTAISDVEVIYRTVPGKMYYFKYKLKNKNETLEVATTRPETMFADQCLVVNPEDDRYKKYLGQEVINPINGQIIPVVGDKAVDRDFGTGVMKCTPAHDAVDFEIGLRHHLAMPLCLQEDGRLNALCGSNYENLDPEVAREKIVNQTKADGTLSKIVDFEHQVGYSERSGARIEPYLSDQWFVRMESLAQNVRTFQMKNEKIIFSPLHFEQVLDRWMTDPHDWTISRQLWWGHQIPAWYHLKTKEIYVGIEPPQNQQDWIRDPDVLDTWFSSALWPLATLGWKPKTGKVEAKSFKKNYFPTDVLVTGYDIIFFWVARMIFQSLELTQSPPFKQVLIHGLVRDSMGRKMSKSLGNGIDPVEIIEKYGADALRFFLLSNSTPGLDLNYSEEKIRDAWNFLNKLWNACRFVFTTVEFTDFTFCELDYEKFYQLHASNLQNKIILLRLNQVMKEVKINLENYQFGWAGKNIYNFIWNDYCAYYLEISKANIEKNDAQLKKETQETLVYVLKNILVMLHPFAPFITEDLYQRLGLKKSIMLEEWKENKLDFQKGFAKMPKLSANLQEINFYFKKLVNASLKIDNDPDSWKNINYQAANHESESFNYFEKFKWLLENIRSFRNETKIGKKTPLVFLFHEEANDLKIAISSKDLSLEKIMSQEDLNEKIKNYQKELQRSEGLLKNPNFLEKAPLELVEKEKSKAMAYKTELDILIKKLIKNEN